MGGLQELLISSLRSLQPDVPMSMFKYSKTQVSSLGARISQTHSNLVRRVFLLFAFYIAWRQSVRSLGNWLIWAGAHLPRVVEPGTHLVSYISANYSRATVFSSHLSSHLTNQKYIFNVLLTGRHWQMTQYMAPYGSRRGFQVDSKSYTLLPSLQPVKHVGT